MRVCTYKNNYVYIYWSMKNERGTGTDCVVVSVALFAAAAIRSANAEGGAQVRHRSKTSTLWNDIYYTKRSVLEDYFTERSLLEICYTERSFLVI